MSDMSDGFGAYQRADRPGVIDAGLLAERIRTVGELIAMLAVPSVPPGVADDEHLAPTVENLHRVSERLGRLLAQAGMADCVRAVLTLQQAIAGLPADESLRTVDDLLTFLRNRLRDVSLPNVGISREAIEPAPAVVDETLEEATPTVIASDATAAEISGFGAEVVASEPQSELARGDAADGSGFQPAQPAVASDDEIADAPTAEIPITASSEAMQVVEAAEAAEADEAAENDDETLDISQFSAKTQAMLRNFKNADLRQRAPGEVLRSIHRSASNENEEIPEPLRRKFLIEAAGDLADLRTAIASFGKMPGSLDDLREVAQVSHKLKGTAATYQFPIVAEIVFCLEALPKALRSVAASQASACLSLLARFADIIEVALHEAGVQGDASEARLQEAQALAAEARHLAGLDDDTGEGADTMQGDTGALLPDILAERATLHLPAVSRVGDDDAHARVEPRQLDKLMHQSDGLVMNRAMLAQTCDEIHKAQSDIDSALARLATINAQLTDLHPLIRQTGANMHGGASGPRWFVRRETSAGTWDDLELDSFTIFDESMRALSEVVLDATTLSSNVHALIQRVARNSDAQQLVLHSMQQTVIHMRLVNLKALGDRVLLAAHQVAQSDGKQIELSITGQDIEIDRNVSEGLISPILHLVRNAVSHGIGTPAERVAQHKPQIGKIWLHASYSGNEVSIEVGDDGRGVNPHQLIAAAVSAEILDAKVADYLSREQALALMFEPNLSTADQANVIAGHGIGLDSVLTEVERLRGTIKVSSKQGRGTVFQIRVPISLSVTRAVHVRVAGNDYAIPFSSVRKVFAVREAEILVSLPDAEPSTMNAGFHRRVRIKRAAPERPLRLPDDSAAGLYDEAPVFSLAELLGLEESQRQSHMALLVEVGQHQAAILVDQVLDESEVVIRALPKHLQRRTVRGASVMSDGRLFLVLDLPELLTGPLGGRRQIRPLPRSVAPEAHDHAPRVLVVDDSISMRRALETMLTGVGYDVRVARDGVEALGAMLEDLPDIIVLDLEMPHLDGFELLSVIGGNEALARTPVVILTSRAAEKHYRQAMELGARGYLTKPCPDDVLIATLQRVLRESQRPS